jgi:hypothetical protein
VLNWLARYAPLRDTLLDEDGRARSSILDVGCGCHGLACAFPGVPFAGTDILFPFALTPEMVGVRNAPGPLPFCDNAFGTVLCLDVLEHIPHDDRAAFVVELTRVAAERVILACPSSETQFADDFVRDVLRPTPVWLMEHYACGLPTPGAIAECAGAVDGFVATELPTGNGLLQLLVALADSLPQFAGVAAHEYASHREEWNQLLGSATFGTSPRKAWVIERVQARTPLVGRDCPRDEVAAALVCPECGGAYGELACSGCGRPLAPDRCGSWDLASTFAGRRLDSDAGQLLWLSPQSWDVAQLWMPALEIYIAASAPGDDCCLVLDASDAPQVAGAVAQACADLAAGCEFGDVLLVTEPTPRPGHTRFVGDPASVAAALQAPVPVS